MTAGAHYPDLSSMLFVNAAASSFPQMSKISPIPFLLVKNPTPSCYSLTVAKLNCLSLSLSLSLSPSLSLIVSYIDKIPICMIDFSVASL